MDSLKMLTTKLQHHSLNDSMTQATDEEVGIQDRDSGTESFEENSDYITHAGNNLSDDLAPHLRPLSIVVSDSPPQLSGYYNNLRQQHPWKRQQRGVATVMVPIPAATAAADGGDNPSMPEHSETGVRGGGCEDEARGRREGSKRSCSAERTVSSGNNIEYNDDPNAVDNLEEELVLINGSAGREGRGAAAAEGRGTSPGSSLAGEKRKWSEAQAPGRYCRCASGSPPNDGRYSTTFSTDEEVSTLFALCARPLPQRPTSSTRVICRKQVNSNSSTLQVPDFGGQTTSSSLSAIDERLVEEKKEKDGQDLGQGQGRSGCVPGTAVASACRSPSCPQLNGASLECPRKRHCNVQMADGQLQRPCLDFEKMQRLLFQRRHAYSNGSNSTRARVVKVKIFNGSSATGASFPFDPSAFAFQSIGMTSYSTMAAVEDTFAR